jgi:crotonobetaine/carnitine-CoA ligase
VTFLLGAMVPILPGARRNAQRRRGARIALAPSVPAHFHAEFAQPIGIGLIDGYGSTETSFVIGAPLAEQAGTMGHLRGLAARVVDAEDSRCPTAHRRQCCAEAPFALARIFRRGEDRRAWRKLWFPGRPCHPGPTAGWVRRPPRDAIRRREHLFLQSVLLSH